MTSKFLFVEGNQFLQLSALRFMMSPNYLLASEAAKGNVCRMLRQTQKDFAAFSKLYCQQTPCVKKYCDQISGWHNYQSLPIIQCWALKVAPLILVKRVNFSAPPCIIQLCLIMNRWISDQNRNRNKLAYFIQLCYFYSIRIAKLYVIRGHP